MEQFSDEDEASGHGGEGAESEKELTFFADRRAVVSCIEELSSDDSSWKNAFESRFDWLSLTLCKYQEQPTLLNPHLHEMIEPITIRLLDLAEAWSSSSDKQTDGQVSSTCE
jgi:hypothetical protein